MTEPLKASSAEDLQLPVLILPQMLPSGEPLRIVIRALEPDEFVIALQGIAGLSAGRTKEKEGEQEQFDAVAVSESLKSMAEQIKHVCRSGIVEPQFSFDGAEPGKADWRVISPSSKMLIFAKIQEISGLGGEAIKALGSFLSVRGGAGRESGSGGGGPDGAVETPAASAPAP